MPGKRFFFVEPSKVGPQHITLIEGYLRALTTSERLARTHAVSFVSSRSTFAHLSADLRANVHHEAVPVMNPEKRRLVLKTFVEFLVVLRYLLKMRSGDLLFVSCVLPTTLLALEYANRVLRRTGFHVTLHGEIEGLFDRSLQRISSYGYWVALWLRKRRPDSLLSLVVIDDFIKQRLLAEFPDKLGDAQISVAYHPITAFASTAAIRPPPARAAVCFIGYRTRFKGFDQFEALAGAVPGLRFVAIGGGAVVDIPGGESRRLDGTAEYIHAIADCSVALFPYIGAYTASLSAAVLDALSAGVHVLATRRACFVALADYFGPDFVTLYDRPEEAASILGNAEWLARQDGLQARRLAQLTASRYHIAGIRSCFEQLVPSPAAGTYATS